MATARFETSADIEKCRSYLRSRSHASYKELSQHLNRDIQGKDRYILQSARHKLEREGIVFVIRTGIGSSGQIILRSRGWRLTSRSVE